MSASIPSTWKEISALAGGWAAEGFTDLAVELLTLGLRLQSARLRALRRGRRQ